LLAEEEGAAEAALVAGVASVLVEAGNATPSNAFPLTEVVAAALMEKSGGCIRKKRTHTQMSG